MNRITVGWLIAEMVAGLVVGTMALCFDAGRIGFLLSYVATVVAFKLGVERVSRPGVRFLSFHIRSAYRVQTSPLTNEPNFRAMACV